MDKYTKLLVIVCIVVFCGVGSILINACLVAYRQHNTHLKAIEPQTVYLATQNVKSRAYPDIDSPYRITLLRTFPFNKKTKAFSSINADACDASICEVTRDSIQARPDNVLILDASLYLNGLSVTNPQEEWVQIKAAKIKHGCLVTIPRNFADSLTHFPYIYKQITALAIDD